MADRHIAWSPFLEQQFSCPDHRFGMEFLTHFAVLHGIENGHDGHSLVVGKIGPHDGHGLALAQPRRSVVQGFIEAIVSARAFARQPLVVLRGRARRNHGRQPRGIGGNDRVVGEAPLQAKPRHAEVRVLVGEFNITGGESGFGYAPWNTKKIGVGDLALDHQPGGLIKQSGTRSAHDQRRHEVFKH